MQVAALAVVVLAGSVAVLVRREASVPLASAGAAETLSGLAAPIVEPLVTVPTEVAVPSLPVTLPPPVTAPAQVPVPRLPAPLPSPAPAPRASAPAGMQAYRGLGTWVDVYDWSLAYTNGRPSVSADDVDDMAASGVQTLYVQAARHDGPPGVLEPERLKGIVERADAQGLRVVAWYLPSLVDPGLDLQRLKAVAALPHVDSVAVDIESRDVGDVAERNRRLVRLSSDLRQAVPGRTLGAILLPPVVLDVVNPAYWPGFPYRELADSYDAWLTMSYWTNRGAGTPYRDAYRYTKENVERLRDHLDQPGAPVHPIGGIGDETTAAAADAYARAVAESGATGGSLYDWRTTGADLWPRLRPLRS